jgi:hypothetical protein
MRTLWLSLPRWVKSGLAGGALYGCLMCILVVACKLKTAICDPLSSLILLIERPVFFCTTPILRWLQIVLGYKQIAPDFDAAPPNVRVIFTIVALAFFFAYWFVLGIMVDWIYRTLRKWRVFPFWLKSGLIGVLAIASFFGIVILSCVLNFATCPHLESLLSAIHRPVVLITHPILHWLESAFGYKRLGPEFVVAPRWAPMILTTVTWTFLVAYWFVLGVIVGWIYSVLRKWRVSISAAPK